MENGAPGPATVNAPAESIDSAVTFSDAQPALARVRVSSEASPTAVSSNHASGFGAVVSSMAFQQRSATPPLGLGRPPGQWSATTGAGGLGDAEPFSAADCDLPSSSVAVRFAAKSPAASGRKVIV